MDNKKIPIFLCLFVATLLMVSSFSSVQVLADNDTDIEYEYVILDTTDQGKVKEAGYEIVENYDSYIMAKKPVEKDPSFLKKNGISVIEQQDDLKKIHLKSGTITKEDVGTIKSKNILSSKSYYIVKAIGPIKQEWKSTIDDHGNIVDYIPENTYITKLSSSEALKLSKKDFVSFVGDYKSNYKISPELKESEDMERITIRTYEDSNSILTKLSSYGKLLKHGKDKVTMKVDGSFIDDIANIEEVSFIEPKTNLELLNADGQWIVQTGESDDRSIWDHGLTGDGQVVGVSDTGLDYDHAAFRDPNGNPIGQNHRKVVNYVAYANDNDNAESGHGTHVSGSIAGNDDPNGNPSTNDGMAKNAKLSFFDIGDASDSLDIPSDYSEIFNPAYEDGARLHSNSWGGQDSSYTTDASAVDEFMWNNKDMLIFYANGNSGDSPSTVGTPATAKNIVSVGASSGSSYSVEDMADFSSRGPTDDGRIKPTIVAPGTEIMSANSDGDLSTNNDGYTSMQGTSMATPITAGSSALIREYFVDDHYPRGTVSNPSAALIKAVLVNGAVEISGSGAYANNNAYPNNDQGWGRIDLENSLEFDGDNRHLKVYDENEGLATGNSNTYNINVDDTSEPFEVTMTYTDYPGSSSASKALVNDLNLKVTAPDGSEYKGNVFSGYDSGESTTGGEYDDLNPLENVLIRNPQSGGYTIEVIGENIPQGPQPYALSVTGGITTGTPPNASFHYSPIDIDVGQTVQFTDDSSDPDGTIKSWSWNFDDGTTSSEQDPTHSYSSEGKYTVKLTVEDNDGLSDSDTKEIFVGNQAPEASFDISSLNPDVNQDVQFTDQSNDPDGSIKSWSWDFGDGSTSSEQNPTHSYSSKGSYTIKLTVTDNEGDDDSTSKEIYVGEKPNEWDFESDPSEWSTSGLWHLADDSDTYGDSNSPTHSMWYGQDSSGDYDTGSQTTGSLTSPSIDLSGVSSAELSFSHWFETESYQDGEYDKVEVTVNGNQVYYKDSTDNNVGSEDNFVKETIDISSYTGSSIDIKFTFDSVDEKENAYRGWYVDDVIVNTTSEEYPPTASFSYSPDNPEVGESIQFTDGSTDSDGTIESWSWDFGDGSTSSNQNPTHSYSSEGTYTIELTVTDDDGLKDSVTKDVTVYKEQAPTADFSYSPTSPKVDENVQFTDGSTDQDGTIESWSWDFGDGSTSNNQNPTHSYSSEGTYTVKLTVTDDDGLTDSVSKDVSVSANQPPSASFSYSPTSPTVDETIQFTDESSDQDGTVESWSWDFGDGSTSNAQNPTHSYSSENTYTVQLTVTDDKGKEDSTSKDITVEKQSELTLGKALDNTELSWTTGGDNEWIPQTSTSINDGDAAQSGDISDYDSTYIQTTVEGSGTLSFYWKVSSEYNYDFLTFYVDGTEQNSISGSTSWIQESYTLSSGTHTLKWSFEKDWYGSSNEDCGWLDDVQFSTDTNQKPEAQFSYSPSSPSTGETIQFTDESTDADGSIESWSWDFGDGSTSSEQNPTHPYSSENTYTVQLTITDDDGATDTYNEDITVDNDQFEKVIDQDFEGDVSGWKASGLWHLVDESETYGDSNSPSTSVWYGQDSTGNYATGSQTTGSLIVPTLDLSGATQAELSFHHWFETENYDYKEFDIVKVTVNGNEVYYKDSTENNVGSENNFVQETIDISPYIGSSVNIEFTFDSVDGDYNDYRGWYVDDVVVKADSGSIASVNTISSHDTLDTGTNDISGVMSQDIDIDQSLISDRIKTTSHKIATTITTKKIQ